MLDVISAPLTGQENPIDPSTPRGALAEFYRAFNARDVDMMVRNWLQTEEASMDNPLGGIRRGWQEIGPVYERIFTGRAAVTVEFFDYSLHELRDAFLAVGRERGRLVAGETTLDLKIRTSRWYVRADGRWRQLHHHGSMEDAELLARYQTAVR